MDVQVFKIVTGEELVARVSSSKTDASVLLLHKPLTLVPGPQGLTLTQSLISAQPDEPVQLHLHSVVMRSVARDEMTNAYIEATTGLKTAGNRVLLG